MSEVAAGGEAQTRGWILSGLRFVARPFTTLAGLMSSHFAGPPASEAANAAGRNAAASLASSPPTPFSFLASSFSVSLIFTALLVNRIHHLVPPRRPASSPLHPTLLLALRIPSLLLLARSIMVLACVLALSAGRDPFAYPFVQAVAGLVLKATTWAGKGMLPVLLPGGEGGRRSDGGADNAAVLWDVFLAVGLSVVSEAFVRALNDDLEQTQGFNLLSFSFLLHVHSHPAYGLPSSLGPNSSSTESSGSWYLPRQLYLHLLLTLLELFTLHISFVVTPFFRRMPPLRLPITFFYSILGQYFVIQGVQTLFQALETGEIRLEFAPVSPAAATNASTARAIAEGGGGADRVAWDGTVWLNRAPEMLFEILILLTVFLRGISALLRRDEITREALLGHPSHLPDLSEDFAFAMVKYGTACLESTRLAGLSNEVSPVLYHPIASFLSSPEHDRKSQAGVVMSRGVVNFKSKSQEGLGNEIRDIAVRERDTERNPWRKAPEMRGTGLRFVKVLCRIGLYTVWKSWRAVRRAGGDDLVRFEDGWRAGGERRRRSTSAPPLGVGVDEEEEDEGEDWLPDSDDDDDDDEVTSDEESEDEKRENESEGEELESPGMLYRDLHSPPPRSHRSPSPLASTSMIPYDPSSSPTDEHLTPILLAHHLSNSESPLTRRRYSTLAHQNPGRLDSASDAYSSALAERRMLGVRGTRDGSGEPREVGRACVVCTVEERTVILWPCRCLAMCEDCRDNLAARTAASSHLCPTCRAPVKGFSRIFIP